LINTRRTGFGGKCNSAWASTNYDQIIHSAHGNGDS
jgi:O-glycosyl hydrolase